MNDKLREALAIVEKYGMKGDVIYKEIEALAASKQEPQMQGEPEVVALGDVIVRPGETKSYCRAIATTDQSNLGYKPLITLQSHREAIAKKDAALDACVDALHKSKQNTLASAQGFYEDYGTTKQTLDDFQDKQLIAEIDAALLEAQLAREWVWLTDEEIETIRQGVVSEFIAAVADKRRGTMSVQTMARAIESKLREKNAGQPAAYEGSDQQRLDDLVHALTGDEGDDDSLKVLERVVAELNGRKVRDLLADDKAGGDPVAWMREGWGPDCGSYVEFYRDDEMGWRDRKEWTPLYTHHQPQAEAVSPDKANNFYLAVCNFLVWIGREGTVHADDPIIDQLSNALHDIDGGVFKDSLKWPQAEVRVPEKKK